MNEQDQQVESLPKILPRRTKQQASTKEVVTNADTTTPQLNPADEAKKSAIGNHLQLLANLCGEYANSLPQATGSLVRAGSNNAILAIARLVGIEAKERE